MSNINSSRSSGVAGWLVAASLGVVALSGCSWHCPPHLRPDNKGKVVAQKTDQGPEMDGEKGSIKVVFRGSRMPRTDWWVDTSVKPKPEFVHQVQKDPCYPITDFGSGDHIMYFSAKKPAIAPDAAVVSVHTSKTTVVEVQYPGGR